RTRPGRNRPRSRGDRVQRTEPGAARHAGASECADGSCGAPGVNPPLACSEVLMTTFLYTHPACLEHDPGRHHPEAPARLRAVLDALGDPEFARLERREAPEAALEDLERVHPRPHVERLLGAVPKSGHVGIDADTVLSPASGRAALCAAG